MERLLSGKLSSKGQITVPKLIRKKLNIAEGDMISFNEDSKGRIFIERVNSGHVCNLCENGYVQRDEIQEIVPCPLCNGTKVIQANDIGDWLMMTVDVGAKFKTNTHISKIGFFYTLSYEVNNLNLDRTLIERSHDTIQIGLLKEQLKQMPNEMAITALNERIYSEIEKKLQTEGGRKVLRKLFDIIHETEEVK